MWFSVMLYAVNNKLIEILPASWSCEGRKGKAFVIILIILLNPLTVSIKISLSLEGKDVETTHI